MQDHPRILGGVYLGWAAVQAVGFAALTYARAALQPRAGMLFVAWGVMLLLVVAFALVGWRLWRHDPRAHTPAIVLAVVALVSFPVGTAVAAYALWALTRRRGDFVHAR